MRFIDEAKIKVAAGHGGPGCVSFRRETFEPRGGPNGGDGGRGGDVIFQASSQLGSLQDFRFRRSYVANSGLHGSGSNKSGHAGADVVIRVPVGTLIKDAETDELYFDFANDGDTWLACKGGRGGKGNTHFKSSTHQAPKFAQPGEEGESLSLKLELKLLADVALIGFPNAGKSTLISKISAAHPKIADYQFTTRVPHLGVVELSDFRSFVVADIPGLIEGAHAGLGLGHKFLKHIERTRILIHLIDGTQFLEEATRPESFKTMVGIEVEKSSFDEAIDNVIERYKAIRRELSLFSEILVHKAEVLVFNKVDAMEADRELLSRAREAIRLRLPGLRAPEGIASAAPLPEEPFLISGVSGEGVAGLLEAVWKQIVEHKELSAPSVPVQMRSALPDDPGIRFSTTRPRPDVQAQR